LGSLEGLRELNRSRVIDALRRSGTASRAELARLTGLSRTTVATLVADLQARGLVVDADGPAGPGRGRPPALLRLDTAAGAAVGIDFDHPHVRVAVADLSSTVLAERTAELDVDRAGAASLDAAAELVDAVLADAGVSRTDVVGIGMGLPGPIDLETGTVGESILPGWSGIRAGAELARRLGLPVELDNDANLGALGERSYGAARGLDDVVYVRIGSGIGAGLVLGGRLYRGAAGLAGEVGHVQVRAEGAVCRCGNRGCLESVAGADAVLAILRDAHGPALNLRGLLDLVAGGDLGARRVVNDAGRAVGRVLADLVNALNPAAVVVGGDLSAAGEPLLGGIREAIDRFAQPGAARAVEVRPGVLGERAEVLGALALVVSDTDRVRSAGLAAIKQEAAIV
jgi:predicted NBD/HSP70 family sugar kinase/biotin operon repressor